jgi:hypothetical protein
MAASLEFLLRQAVRWEAPQGIMIIAEADRKAVTAAPSVPHQVETYFRHAFEVARQQQVKSLQLRATMSLSRLGQHQGKCVEARQLLAGIYGWFTERFGTADLQEAKALLDE